MTLCVAVLLGMLLVPLTQGRVTHSPDDQENGVPNINTSHVDVTSNPLGSHEPSLEDTLTMLDNLTSTQKLLWEQQRLREEELRLKNQEDMEREANRTKALENEFRLLNEMRGRVNRKLRVMSRNGHTSTSASSVQAPTEARPKDCADVYLNGAEETSGLYRVWPTWDLNGRSFFVYCDMDTDGGGWTVIRRWGTEDFTKEFFKKTWNEYKVGFGNLKRDFWLGNEQIHQLTNQDSYELRFDVSSSAGNLSTTYNKFWIDSGDSRYTAHVDQLADSSTAVEIFKNSNDVIFSVDTCLFGWWNTNYCSVNSLLVPYATSEGKHNGEMKIRPVSFTILKNSS